MSFWRELKRRNVYKVGIAYAIAAWLIVQAAAIVFPHLDFPEWTVHFVIVLLIIGFPLILLFAWAFEITPEGIKRTKEVPLAESITHLTGKKLNYILAGLLVIALGYIIMLKFFTGGGPVETELAPTVTEQSTTTTDEDIANSVADKLKLTLESHKLLGGTENIKAYEFYLIAQGQISQGTGSFNHISRILDLLDSAIALDPEFALAWALKASTHQWSSIESNSADIPQRL